MSLTNYPGSWISFNTKAKFPLLGDCYKAMIKRTQGTNTERRPGINWGTVSLPGPLWVWNSLGPVIPAALANAEMNQNILNPKRKGKRKGTEARESEGSVFSQLNTCFHCRVMG
jgi:hypothetical protein